MTVPPPHRDAEVVSVTVGKTFTVTFIVAVVSDCPQEETSLWYHLSAVKFVEGLKAALVAPTIKFQPVVPFSDQYHS